VCVFEWCVCVYYTVLFTRERRGLEDLHELLNDIIIYDSACLPMYVLRLFFLHEKNEW